MIGKSKLAVPTLATQREGFTWRCDTTLEKYHARSRDVLEGLVDPYKRIEVPGNVLTYGGVDILWMGIKKLLSTNAGVTKNEYFDNTHAALLVGDTNTAALSSHQDLKASSGVTHRWVHAMDATFPTHTTGATLSTNAKILFKSTFTSSQANFAWQEWAVGNAISQAVAYPGRILNRKVASLGTKSTLGTWALTVALSIA